MELTEVEKRLIEDYRNGADIDVHYHGVQTYEEAMKVMNGLRIERIHEQRHSIVFGTEMYKQIETVVFLRK